MSRYSDVFGSQKIDINAFFGYRLPKPPPADENEEAVPGRLCWGTTGELPTGELAESVGFDTSKCNEVHNETKRVTEDREIASEDDPDTSILVKRLKKLYVNKTETNEGEPSNSTTSEPEGLLDFVPEPIQWESFKPLETENKKRCRYVITLNPNDARAV